MSDRMKLKLMSGDNAIIDQAHAAATELVRNAKTWIVAATNEDGVSGFAAASFAGSPSAVAGLAYAAVEQAITLGLQAAELVEDQPTMQAEMREHFGLLKAALKDRP